LQIYSDRQKKRRSTKKKWADRNHMKTEQAWMAYTLLLLLLMMMIVMV
jgi:hypothetical protein